MVDPVLALVSTVRHDGRGGVADDLGDLDRCRRWLGDPGVEEAGRLALVGLRQAVRSLFAVVVAPEPPSAADADRLPSVAEAVRLVNAAVLPERVWLEWAAGPVVHTEALGGNGIELVLDRFARAAIAFLTSPARLGLRACRGPRCVKYYVREHPRQGWCSPACGNRARVSRHYRRRVD
ncbi:ABATE domain-containing protein [Crossiella sp. CA-258035]|uniref:CGNR zinc finger domain-containing protein n=1 Tax=Crossiella sp. CA-258035 TaxID=2981138 RepID=UPI0032DAB0A3